MARNLDVRPLAGALGAEIHGIDLALPMDDDTFAAVRRALLDHCVIFFRDQDITPAQQLAFAKRWGPPHLHPHLPGLPDHPEILEIVKTERDVHNLGGDWHTDQIFTPTPAMGTMLYARQVPAFGGDTMFTNMYAALETLSPAMRAMLAGLRTVNIYDKAKPRAAAMQVTAPGQEAETAEHPLVRRHPETGRAALYLSYWRVCRRLAGMTDAESRPLLDFLCAHSTRPEFTCRFRWEKGSLALWDNRCTQHLAINDYQGRRRVMHRVTICGDVPVAA